MEFFNGLTAENVLMLIDKTWLVVVMGVIACIVIRFSVPYGIKKAKQFSTYMYELTHDESGEDSNQWVKSETARLEAARLEDERVAGRRVLEAEAPSLGRLHSIKAWLKNNFGSHSTIIVVEHESHSGKEKRGVVVGSRNQGLHGQARVNYGHYSVWRDWSKLKKVS